MNTLAWVFAAVLAAPNLAPPATFVSDHSALFASVATYRSMAGFNHVVGKARFVGYFRSAPDRCDLTVFQAVADDESLATPPRRFEFTIAAGGRAELDAGDGAALAIACTIDADSIRIAPENPQPATAARL